MCLFSVCHSLTAVFLFIYFSTISVTIQHQGLQFLCFMNGTWRGLWGCRLFFASNVQIETSGKNIIVRNSANLRLGKRISQILVLISYLLFCAMPRWSLIAFFPIEYIILQFVPCDTLNEYRTITTNKM